MIPLQSLLYFWLYLAFSKFLYFLTYKYVKQYTSRVLSFVEDYVLNEEEI